MPAFRRSPSARPQPGGEDARAEVGRFLAELRPHQRMWFAQVLLGMGLLVESSVVELAVPVVRTVTGKRGVQTGPALGSLVTFLAFQAYTTAIGREVTSEGGARAEYLPAFGAVLPGSVVLRKRSPLWGLALWPLVRLIAVCVLVAEASRLAKLHPADEARTEPVGD